MVFRLRLSFPGAGSEVPPKMVAVTEYVSREGNRTEIAFDPAAPEAREPMKQLTVSDPPPLEVPHPGVDTGAGAPPAPEALNDTTRVTVGSRSGPLFR
jgi:hypothetical protein